LLCLVCAPAANADPIIFQSAIQEHAGASGIAVAENQFVGARFFVSAPTRTTRIGGHFGLNGLDVFGALVGLTRATDFPDSLDLSTPDVLGVARLTTPFGEPLSIGLHSEVLSVQLQRGWYALVFGASLFGAERGGFLTTEHQQLGSPRFFLRDVQGTYRSYRFNHPSFTALLFVEGESTPPAVPEPGTVLLIGSGLVAVVARRRGRTAALAACLRRRESRQAAC
jgi:hypothetical protein